MSYFFVETVFSAVALIATFASAFFVIRSAKLAREGKHNPKVGKQAWVSIIVGLIANAVSAATIIFGLATSREPASVSSAVMSVIVVIVFALMLPGSRSVYLRDEQKDVTP